MTSTGWWRTCGGWKARACGGEAGSVETTDAKGAKSGGAGRQHARRVRAVQEREAEGRVHCIGVRACVVSGVRAGVRARGRRSADFEARSCEACADRVFRFDGGRCPGKGCTKVLKRTNLSTKTWEEILLGREMAARSRVTRMCATAVRAARPPARLTLAGAA